jgi:GMC oxidoreductase
MTNANEMMQVLLDQVASGQLSRRRFLTVAGAAGLTAGLSAAMVGQAFAAGDDHAANQAKLEGAYDYIVVGAGASGAIVAGELSKTGAKVLVVESGGADTAPTISNPSIWFYNVGGPLDWKLPIAPVPQLNNRKFNMALGHVLGGGSSINALVWSRGMERDYDAWERSGAGWGFKDVLPTYKAQEDWEGGANEWRGAGGPVHIRKPGDPHPTAPAFIEAARHQYKGKMPDRPADSNAVEAEVYLSSGVDSFRSRRRRRLPVSARPRKKASRSRRRSFNQPAMAMSGLPARIGAMHPSSKATIWAPTAISPPSCGRSKRPASLAARPHSTASVKRRSYRAPKPPTDRT